MDYARDLESKLAANREVWERVRGGPTAAVALDLFFYEVESEAMAVALLASLELRGCDGTIRQDDDGHWSVRAKTRSKPVTLEGLDDLVRDMVGLAAVSGSLFDGYGVELPAAS